MATTYHTLNACRLRIIIKTGHGSQLFSKTFLIKRITISSINVPLQYKKYNRLFII